MDKVNHQVTVRAGTTFRELVELLHQHGLAMKNLGAIPHQTAAGAISTGIQKVQEDTPSPHFRPIGILSPRSHILVHSYSLLITCPVVVAIVHLCLT